jgi:phage baseplate assembly protein W
MAIRFKQRELIEIDPIDLEPKKALGVKIPFRSTGSPFELNYTTKDQVKSNLLNLLLTNPGERFNEPLFGVGISQQLFKQNISEEDLQSTITTQTELFVPEVSVENIEIIKENQFVDIKIIYKLKANNAMDAVTLTINY